ncbi:alanyl-tRNA editing protein [Priestia megaterium]|nr:alanyl-tRNA editing protein [Priestia megaterium]
MTERLYYTSPYTSSWTTTIKDIIKCDHHYLITLRETAFYPEGGGQPSDSGKINGIQIEDVFEENGEIYHKLSTIPESSTVNCELDWNRRFDHMQQHTGQHLLSAVLIDTYDIHTVSFHLGNDAVSIDLKISSISEEQLTAVEHAVNTAIYANKEIKTYHIQKEEIHTVPLRRIPEVEGHEVRIVEIDTIDFSACCGTHVTRTGELGMIKLIKTEKQRGNTRLFFKSGMRALADYQQSHNILSAVSNKFSTNRDLVLERLEKVEHEQKLLLKQLEQLQAENAHYLCAELQSKKEGSLLVHEFKDRTLKDVQPLIKQLLQTDETVLILSSALEQKVLFAHNSTSNIHCGELFKILLPSFNGKGGGGPKQAQASFSSNQELQSFVISLKEKLSS